MNEKTMLNVVNANDNFLATAITPWHMASIKVAIDSLKNEGFSLSGVIFICKVAETSKLIDVSKYAFGDNFRFVECNYDDIGWFDKIYANFYGTFSIIKDFFCHSHNKSFFVCNVLFPNIAWSYYFKQQSLFRNIHYILIDEGVGSYLTNGIKEWVGLRQSKNATFFKRFINFISLYTIACLRILPQKICRTLLNRQNRIYETLLFKEQNIDRKIVLIKRDDIILKYRLFFEKNKDISNSLDTEDYILLNTQPLVEDGLLSKREYNDLLLRLHKVFSLFNFKIKVKFHPRETNFDEYAVLKNVEVIKDGRCQEEIIGSSQNRPLLVISPNSTTLVTLNLLWGIPSISLAFFLEDYNIDESFRSVNLNFINTFKEFVLFPHNDAELIKILKQILTCNSKITAC